MARRYQPDPDKALTALAGRLDALEHDLRQNSADVTALGRGVTDLTIQIRHFTTTASASSGAGSSAGDGAGGSAPVPADAEDGEADNEEVGQPDWFAVEDPDAAVEILADLTEWVEQVGSHHGIVLPVACWVLHPDVVADLLALTSERDSATPALNPPPCRSGSPAGCRPPATGSPPRCPGARPNAATATADAPTTWPRSTRPAPGPGGPSTATTPPPPRSPYPSPNPKLPRPTGITSMTPPDQIRPQPDTRTVARRWCTTRPAPTAAPVHACSPYHRDLVDAYHAAREAAEQAREHTTRGWRTELREHPPLLTFRDWLQQTSHHHTRADERDDDWADDL
jgi:hypothetical protein